MTFRNTSFYRIDADCISEGETKMIDENKQPSKISKNASYKNIHDLLPNTFKEWITKSTYVNLTTTPDPIKNPLISLPLLKKFGGMIEPADDTFDELQKKKISCSVAASKRRVKAAKKEFGKKLNKATKTLIGSDVTITKRSYAKLKLIIEEAALTGQKDETYSQYLDKQKTKLMKYEEEIDEVRLKININKHRQLIEQTQPTVKEGLDQLKKESGINADESVEIEDPEKESDYTHINEETPFEESQKTVIKKSEKSEDKE